MSEFELLVIPLSVVLGVGAATMLEGFIFAIRHRERRPLHWLPIAWAAFIFMYIVTFFSVLWAVNGQNPNGWTWPLLGMMLIHAILYFLSAGLILASDDVAAELGMLENYRRHGRLALIPFALSFAVAIPFNKWVNGPDWISQENLLNVVLIPLTILTFRARTPRLQTVGTLAFGVVSLAGWFWVFARPGGS